MLNYKLITASPHAKLAAADIKMIEEIVGWKRPAFFPKLGRSAWLKLTQPITVSLNNSHIHIQSVKIKGVGLFNQHNEQIKPSSVPFYRRILHLGFKPDGTFTLVPSPPVPIGGMPLDRGIMEFFISGMLNMHGCPAQVPLRLYQYDEADMTFDIGRNVPTSFCVTVTGLPTDNCLRVDAIDNWMHSDTISKNEPIFQVLDTWADSLNVPEHAYKPLATWAKISYLYGQTLRKFHEIGYYRHNGSIINLIYSPQHKATYFTDLDSSRPLVECSAITKPLQHIRDIASYMAYIPRRLLNKRYIHDIPHERIFEDDMYNPFKQVLLGYYHDVPQNIVEKVMHHIRKDYERRYSIALQRHANRLNNVVIDDLSYQERYYLINDIYWVNFDELFPFYISVMWNLHEHSELGKCYPHQISKTDIYGNIAELISPEFAQYLNENT
ncbi:MAG: hypothetical protein B6242_04435 [Anaerolineaceae bacterium 4572_78]|nr:MAG: hypothetical protein B6242_04435 [Anaerolineaceae bacterium 4572_78]